MFVMYTTLWFRFVVFVCVLVCWLCSAACYFVVLSLCVVLLLVLEFSCLVLWVRLLFVICFGLDYFVV